MVEDRTGDRVRRRLEAILMADVVGYSRLMGSDEDGTLARLKRLRATVVNPIIDRCGGHVVKEMGDGLLAEFPSVVGAVECAVAIQRSVVEDERKIVDDKRIRYRIGVNLGDVVVDDADIFGDGVNIAARLESLAEPDGIRISGAVYDQVRGKLEVAFEPLGEQIVKNIAEPVRVYRVLPFARPSEVDVARAEREFRQAVRDRYAEEVSYYVALTGQTAARTPEERAKAPRSARRFGRRARVDFHELVAVGEDIKQVRLDDLREAAEKFPCTILLGDPGSGKSTAIEALAFEYAGRPDWLPVPLRLGEFAGDMSAEEFVRRGLGGSRQAGHWGAASLAANLTAYLEAGKLLLLFDALNEMPQERYRERCQALRAFIEKWSARGNRFVVTCRRLDYDGELSGLQRVEVQALSDTQIRQFLQNELPEKWQALWQALLRDDAEHRLMEMARNPYLLTVMIDVFEEDGELRRNRADLMQRCVEIMLEWARAECAPDEWLDADLQVEALGVMAYEMQARSGFGTEVKTDQVKAVMPRQVQPDPNWPAEDTPHDRVLRLAASAKIVEIPADRMTVRFRHQLLQEYFAARCMVKKDPATLLACWRVPRLEAELPPWRRPDNNYEPLPPPAPTGWEETTILAAAMITTGDRRFLPALLEVNPVLAARCLLQPGSWDEELRRAAVTELLAMIADADVALRVRIAAGQALGQLGDPRLGDMVRIPAGEFLMGEGREQHVLALAGYRIGKYPVSNAEFRRFVDAGGYRDRTWWTAAGWLEVGEKQSEPRFWHDARFNKPNQPVMGLSWYECVAYCRWLSKATGECWRLPSEAEWEKAARGGDGRLFPWGNEFDASRLNGRGPRDRQVCTSTPVGCYPTGASPYGLFDCVGNVWEWCATRWKKTYPYDIGQDEWQAAYLEGQNLRVLRGGSWYDDQQATRCTHRFRFQPYGWNDRGGFRIVAPA